MYSYSELIHCTCMDATCTHTKRHEYIKHRYFLHISSNDLLVTISSASMFESHVKLY